MNKAPLKSVSFDLIEHWIQQIETEQLAWAKTTLPNVSPERLKDYQAGLQTGMRQILATLRLQDLLKVTL